MLFPDRDTAKHILKVDVSISCGHLNISANILPSDVSMLCIDDQSSLQVGTDNPSVPVRKIDGAFQLSQIDRTMCVFDLCSAPHAFHFDGTILVLDDAVAAKG